MSSSFKYISISLLALVVSLKCKTTPPPNPPTEPILSAPDLIAPINNSTNQDTVLSFLWDIVTNATQYTIHISDNNNFSSLIIDKTTSSNNYTTTFQIEKTYYWRVKAINSTAESQWSDTWMFATIPRSAIPTVMLVSPSNNAVSVCTFPTLKWRPVSNINTYQLHLSEDSTFTSQMTAEVESDSSAFDIPNLSANTTFFWRVRAKSIQEYGNWSSIWSFTTSSTPCLPPLTTPIPLKPSLVNPLNGSTVTSDSVILIWRYDANATDHALQLTKDSTFSPQHIDTNLPSIDCPTISSVCYHTIYNLMDSLTYYWRVKSKNSAGESDWSAIWSFITNLSQ